ncbi:MAG: hypothetical protein IT436_00700 [Phycisphaerales bacterium]|nr:hypothetical protein [Phycisphaerales bacterium]
MARRPVHPLLRAAVLVPLLGTIAVHAAAWWGLVSIRIDPHRRQITDSPAETVVTFSLPPQPAPVPQPEPPPPPPPPTPEPEPEPPAPEPEPQPAEIAIEAPKVDKPAPPRPQPAPRPAPRPAPVVTVPQPGPARAPEPAPASFAGVQGPRASRVVYLVDASGPMASSLPLVLSELDRSVSRLNAAQSFQVIVFREPPPPAPGRESARALEVFGGAGSTLLPATDDQKQRLRTWLAGIQPSGRSDPREALVAGLSLKPELVFLLTRSIRRSGPDSAWAGGNRAVLETLDRLNPADPATGRRPVVIKAIQFIDDDPSGLLKAIASLHGDGPGSYRVMDIEELPSGE